MKDDTISRAAAIDALHTWFRDGFDEDKWWNSTHVLAAIEGLPSAQQIPWDRKTRNSMVNTLQMLRRLAYNIHGVMDVVDDDNVGRLIEWLEGGQDGTPRAVLSQKPVR